MISWGKSRFAACYLENDRILTILLSLCCLGWHFRLTTDGKDQLGLEKWVLASHSYSDDTGRVDGCETDDFEI